jgi:MFS family permease
MPMPAQAQQTPRPGGGPGPIHYSWVIVGILVVVQVIGSAISQSAGIMVAPLRDPHGDFGWGIGTIGALMAVYYLVGGVFAPVSGWLGARYGARRLMLAGGCSMGAACSCWGWSGSPGTSSSPSACSWP